MGTDCGNREAIERQADEARYGAFVDALLFLPTVQEIREAVTSTKGLDSSTLARVMTALEGDWRRDRREARARLLDHVRSIVVPMLRREAPDNAPVIDVPSLVQALLRAPDALRMRSTLLAHRRLLTPDLVDAVRAVIPEDDAGPSRELCLAMYLVPRMAGDPRGTIVGLLMWSAFCRRNHLLQHAARHLARAAALAQRLDDSFLRLTIVGSQAGLYRATNQYREACAALEEGLALAEQKNDTTAALSFADGLASCYCALGSNAKALDAASRLVTLADGYPGRKSRALNRRGLLYETLGRNELGAIDYAEAAKIAAAEGDRSEAFIALNNAAASLLKRGLARDGVRAFQDILQRVEHWGNPLMAASTHNNLGHALYELDEYAAARVEYDKALQAKVNTSDKMGEVTAWLGLGHCSEALGEVEEARARYTMALVPAMESGNATLLAQVNLALTGDEVDDGDIDASLQSLRSTRCLMKEGEDDAIQAALVARAARLLRRAGRTGEAIRECEEFLNSRTGQAETEHLLHVSIEYARALGADAGSWQQGIEVMLDCLAAVDRRIEQTLVDTRLAEIAGSAKPLYGAILDMLHLPWAQAVGGSSPAMLGFALHEAAKARSLLARLCSSDALTPPTGLPTALREEEAALLADERRWQEERVTSELRRHKRLGAIRASLRDCYDRMRPIAPDYVRARQGTPASFAELHSALRAATPAATALLSFYVGEETTTCFVVRPDRVLPMMVSVPLSSDLIARSARELLRAFNGAPDEFPPYPPIRGDRPFKRPPVYLDALSTAMAPVFKELDGVELICAAPHGPLHAIPLHALRLGDGRYVAEKAAVIYSPSLSVAAVKMRRPPTPRDAGRRDKAFVAGVSSADDVHPEYFEADIALFDAARWDVQDATGVHRTTRQDVLNGMRGSRVVHISCHAFFEPRNPRNSGLVLSNGVAKAPRDLRQLTFFDRQQYLLTVRDLLGQDLDADLVTLNACSTGRQRERNAGDELEGFGRALLSAGAGAALLTSWDVDQASSYKFLSRFYHHWSTSGLPAWQSLHAVQKEFIFTGGIESHPYHWAPFSLLGQWR